MRRRRASVPATFTPSPDAAHIVVYCDAESHARWDLAFVAVASGWASASESYLGNTGEAFRDRSFHQSVSDPNSSPKAFLDGDRPLGPDDPNVEVMRGRWRLRCPKCGDCLLLVEEMMDEIATTLAANGVQAISLRGLRAVMG